MLLLLLLLTGFPAEIRQYVFNSSEWHMLFVLTSWSGSPDERITSKVAIRINNSKRYAFPFSLLVTIFFPSFNCLLLPLLPQNLQAPKNLVKIVKIPFLLFLCRVKSLSQDD